MTGSSADALSGDALHNFPATEADQTIGDGYEGEVDQIRISGGQMQEPEMDETVIAYSYNARNQLVRRVEEEQSQGSRPWWARLAGRTYTFYSYDRNGNQIAEQTFGGKTESKYHAYDKLNRMTRTVSVKGSLWSFWGRPEINVEAHEYAGAEWRRVANTANGEKTSFVYDGDNVVVDKVGGEATRQYVTPFLDQNLTMTVLDGEQAGTYYYSQDGLGSVRTLTDATGTVVNRYDYTAFGQAYTPDTISSIDQRYTYTGREWEVSGGVGYYRYRHYFPGACLFGNRNPWGYIQFRFGLYDYVGNSPILFMEPFSTKTTRREAWGARVASWVSDRVHTAKAFYNRKLPGSFPGGTLLAAGINTGIDMAGGVGDVGNVGTGLGNAMYGDGTVGEKAVDVLKDVGRGLQIAGPLGKVAGKGVRIVGGVLGKTDEAALAARAVAGGADDAARALDKIDDVAQYPGTQYQFFGEG